MAEVASLFLEPDFVCLTGSIEAALFSGLGHFPRSSPSQGNRGQPFVHRPRSALTKVSSEKLLSGERTVFIF